MSTGRITPFPANPEREIDLYSIPENTSLIELETAIYELSKVNGDWKDGQIAATRKMLTASHLTALASHQVCEPVLVEPDKNGLPQGAAFTLASAFMIIAEVAHRCGINLEESVSCIQKHRLDHPELVPLSETLTAPATIYTQQERRR